MRDDADPALTPQLLLSAYRAGLFPMAEAQDDPEIFWVDPRRRGIFPLAGFHISRSLAKRIRSAPWRVTRNLAFAEVVAHCADRPETWINAEIVTLYQALFDMGSAQSLEIWDGRDLIGGVYGVTCGAAFFGESMFSRRRDASKLALAYLVTHLCARGFTLFDTQFLTSHLASLGAVEITRAQYHEILQEALAGQADFRAGRLPETQDVLQRRTQTS